MKKKILLFTLLTTSLLMTGCDPTTSSSSSSSPSESIQEVHVDSIKITNADVTMKVGEVLTLNVNVLPNNAVNKLVNFESSDSSVASVDFNGKVTARKVGTCKIKAISDDDSTKFDEINIKVEEASFTSLKVEFDDDVDIVETNNNKFYKLVVGEAYHLNISVTPSGDKLPELEAEFNLKDYCSFDNKTNTLTALKRTDNVTVTFKIKGTNIKQEFNLKIINQGEKGIDEVINKLNNSSKLESQKKITHYDINYDFDVVDLNLENRTHTIENTSFNIYKNGGNYFMLGDGSRQVTKNNNTKTTDFTTFKGIDGESYYEFQVDDNGNHLSDTYRKTISSEDSKVTISTATAIKKSTIFTLNSHDGLSEIAKFQMNFLYENSYPSTEGITIGSLPMYFGGKALKNTTISEENNVISVDSYFIEKRPSSAALEKGEVYFNHGEYTFTNDILTSISVTSKVYNNDSFDFNNETLKENPETVKTFKLAYTQSFGKYQSFNNEQYNPNKLYFTDYTPILLDSNKKVPLEYEIGKSYDLSYTNPTPNMATASIDGLKIMDNSNPSVATISSDQKSITINASGSTTLGVYSTKNNIKKEIVVTVGKVEAEEIKILINNKEVSGTIEAKVNEKIDNISFKVNPNGASQDVDVSISDGEGILTPNENGTYSFMSTKEGQSTLLVKARGTNISSSIIFNVTKEAEANTLIEKMMKNTYECKDLTDFEYKHSLKITSSTTAVFTVIDALSSGNYVVNCNILINETNKTIEFTSFDPVSDDYTSLPMIPTNKSYKITDENSFEVNFVFESHGEIVDFIEESIEIHTYHFNAKAE